jgi:hypothetical protein
MVTSSWAIVTPARARSKSCCRTGAAAGSCCPNEELLGSWGGAGEVTFWILGTDLAAHRFDRVLVRSSNS